MAKGAVFFDLSFESVQIHFEIVIAFNLAQIVFANPKHIKGATNTAMSLLTGIANHAGLWISIFVFLLMEIPRGFERHYGRH